MPRNPSLPLSVESLANVASVSDLVFGAEGSNRTFRFEYVKRDGTHSSSEGSILTVLGQNSTLSVRIDTPDKGERTVNLAGMLQITEI